MVLTNQAIEMVLNNFPGFRNSEDWKYCCSLFEDREMSTHGIMSAFSTFIEDKIALNDMSFFELKRTFTFIEKLLVHGDASVQEGVATCFLENLINATSWGTIHASSFVPYLGKKSVEYCKGWDEFTGVKTEDLWEKT